MNRWTATGEKGASQVNEIDNRCDCRRYVLPGFRYKLLLVHEGKFHHKLLHLRSSSSFCSGHVSRPNNAEWRISGRFPNSPSLFLPAFNTGLILTAAYSIHPLPYAIFICESLCLNPVYHSLPSSDYTDRHRWLPCTISSWNWQIDAFAHLYKIAPELCEIILIKFLLPYRNQRTLKINGVAS